jgi:hypothetical protein
MAHLQKFTKADYPKFLMHYERAKYGNGEYNKYKNQDIDLSRTHQNYNVAGFQTLPQSEFMDKRLSQLKIFDRDDVKYMCEWIITLPQNMGNEERRFFDAVFKFLTDKYKKENVISAYVHKDETTPHMHFAFVPVAVDKKKNVEKLCSKDIVGRDDLFAFHEELDNYLTSVFGYSTGVRNGATKEGNKSIDELKRGTAVKEQRALDTQTRAKKSELQKITKDIEGIKIADGSIKIIKEKRNEVLISREDYDRAAEALIKKYIYESKAREADQRAQRADEERKQAVNRNYEKEIGNLRQENFAVRERYYSADRQSRKNYSALSLIKAVLAENLPLNAEYLRALNQYLKQHPELQNEMEAE